MVPSFVSTCILFIALAGWITYRRRQRIAEETAIEIEMRRAEGYRSPSEYDTYYGAPRPVSYRAGLVSTDVVSRELSKLADTCPDCDGDHVGKCGATFDREAREGKTYQELADNDVATGVIHAVVTDVPEARTPRDVADYTREFIRQYNDEWHMVDGQWYPPAALTDALGEDDWLTQLLTQPVLIGS